MEGKNSLTVLLLLASSLAYKTTSVESAPSGSAADPASDTAKPHEVDVDQSPDDTLRGFVVRRHPAGARYVIALVPDPINTHLSISFDRAIESIENAASDSHYSFDRYWVPWRENPYKATDKTHDHFEQEEETRQREAHPGVLLFRGPGNGADRRDLIVFLVAETPTSGINVTEFAEAVDYISARLPFYIHTPTQLPGGAEEIMVAGPSFSGSFDSLKSAIAVTKGQPHFLVYSGSTTASSQQSDFRRFHRSGPGPRVDGFYTMVHPDDVSLCAFLTRIQPGEKEVVFLSEGDTGFGQAIREAGEHDSGEMLTSCPGAPKVLQFPFPRDIARLRNAYHEDFLTAPLPDTTKVSSREGLSFTLKDPVTGHDSVPSFSHTHTPYSQDATLSNLTAFLRRHDVKYLGIFATDNLDAFFLARFLAVNSPDIRLFMPDADLMFVRPPESLPLAGMLSVTTYPLLAENQAWIEKKLGDSSSRPRRVFSSRFTEGVYNALLALLRDQYLGVHANQRDKDAKDPLRLPYLLDYSSPWQSDGDAAPLWLTAAGRNGYWPVEILHSSAAALPDAATLDSSLHILYPWESARSESDPVSSGKQAASPESHEVPHIYHGVLMIGVLLSILFALGYWMANWPGTSRFRSSKFVSDFSLGDGSTATNARATSNPNDANALHCELRAPFLLVIALALAVILFMLDAPIWKLGAVEWFDWINVIPIVFLVASAGNLLLPSFRANPSVTIAAIAVSLAWTGGYYWCLRGPDNTHYDFFLAYRSINFSSGLSPILPVIWVLIAFIVWARMHWQRCILFSERKQKLPKIPGTHFERTSKSISKIIEDFIIHWTALLCGLIGGAITLCVALPHLVSFEHGLFNAAYCFTEALLVTLLALTAMRFLLIWLSFETLLEQLELHPIRFALDALPADRGWSPIWQSNVNKRSHVLLGRGADCLHAISKNYLSFLDLDKACEDLDHANDALLGKVATGQSESVHQRSAAQTSFEIASRLAENLSTRYWRRGSWQSKWDIPPEPPKLFEKNDDALAAEFVAIRVLAFVRYVMLHLRNQLGFLTSGFMLGLVSLYSYPFQSPQIIGSLTLALFAALGGIVAWVFYRMYANGALKRITTNEGKTDYSFWLKLAETGALPVLAIVASNVPGAGQFLFSWLGPLIDKLH